GEWTQGLEFGAGKLWNSGSFRRGMLEGVRVDAPGGFDGAEASLKQADVRGLVLERVGAAALDSFLARPWLSRLASLRATLRLTYWGNDGRVRELAKAPGLRNLAELDLFDSDLGDSQLTILFENLQPTALARLLLEGNNVGTGSASALGACRWLTN